MHLSPMIGDQAHMVSSVLSLGLASLAGVRNVFAFGDSFTYNGWNGSSDPLAPYTARCSAAGPPWSEQFARMTGTRLINLAVGGATADQSIINTPPLDFRGQATAFIEHVMPFPAKVNWNSADSLFVISFGTNDVNKSFKDTIGNGTDLYDRDLTSYFATVDRLYNTGARKFVFNNVVPFDRAQIGINYGPRLQEKLKHSINEFNAQLSAHARKYCEVKTDIATCLVFDTHALFTNLMDNFSLFGFVSPDGFCEPYANRRDCEIDPQIHPACLGPASAYIWKNGLHPSFASHRFWAQSLIQQLEY